jgi:FkbM family methyltransferase
VSESTPTNFVRRSGQKLMNAVPETRKVKGLGGAKGRRVLQARKLVAPMLPVPVRLTTNTGLKLRITTDPVDEQIAQHLLGSRRGDYFPDWPGAMPESPCILDIGAHHGLYAAAALHVYPDSRIVCVEPSGAACAALRTNLALNDFAARARIVQAALAPTAGTADLLHTADGTWGYSLYEDADAATGAERVALVTLSEILGRDRPVIVKSNAEGAEYSLVEQLEATDVRPLLMIVMVHPDFGDMDDLLDRAKRMGYRVSSIGSDERPAFHMWHESA